MLAKGQISYFYNEKPISIPKDAFTYYVDTSDARSFERYQAIAHDMRPMLANSVNLSYKDAMLWLKISLRHVASHNDLRFLMVRNPHINFIGYWILKHDQLFQGSMLSGDHYPFSQRMIRHPDFVFPLPEDSLGNMEVLLLIDKRNEQLNIPIHLLTEAGFVAHNQHDDLLAGAIAGIGVLLFLLNMFLFFKMKERLYVFYGLYIFMAFLYILSDFGLTFMYVFPRFYQLADFTRPMTISFAAPLYVLFCLHLLDAKKNMPIAYKWSMRYLLLYVIVLISGMALMRGYGQLRIVLLWLMQIFQNINALFALVLACIGLKKKVPYSSYVIASSSILIICFLFFMNFLSGYVADNLFTRNLMNLGFVTEISILAFVLTLRFKDYKERNEALLREVNLQQERIFQSLADFREKEMLRISSLLHDSVGAGLSGIRLHLESAASKSMDSHMHIDRSITQLNDLANEVRSLSHSLSPILLQKNGLVKSLRNTVANVNISNRLYIQFESIGSLQQAPVRYEMLVYNVVQELVQNIIKHAGATEAIIQIMLEKELISIFVEDNGRGFDEKSMKDGLGYLQIKQLIRFVNGSFHVKAVAGSGTQVSIEFPVLADERTNKDIDSR